MLALLLAACTVMPYHRPPVTVVPPLPPPAVAAVDVSALLDRIDGLLALTTSVDVRDRLVELRELVLSAASGDPALRSRVLQYAERALTIEERSSEQVIPEAIEEAESSIGAVIEEELIDSPFAGAVARAEAAVAEGRWEDALTALSAVPAGADPTAATLQKRASDGWARGEREAAAVDFLRARALPAGAERVAALSAVRTRLQAVNQRFPDNVVAQEVRRHLETVDAAEAEK